MASAPPLEEENIIRSPDLPFVSAIVGGLLSGRAVVISGMVQPSFAASSTRFNIDLCCGLLIQGDHMDNKALHMNPRFDPPGGWLSGTPDRQLVLNSYINNQWGTEDRYANPFEEGKPFQIRILALANYFKIAVNGKHVCDYAHRVPLESIKTVFITGNVRLDFVEFQPALSSNGTPIQNPFPNQDNLRVTTIDRPEMPFSWQLPIKGFVSPYKIKITLTPFVSAKSFSINIMAEGEHIFHIRVDMPFGKEKAALVRNSTKKGAWQTEERSLGQFPFNKGLTHDVVIHAYSSSLAMDVDSLPCCKFQYRPGDNPIISDRITVTGDVILQRFVYTNQE